MGRETQNVRKLSYPVAVIGAGVSGLVSVKSCLEENLEVVCYEKTDIIAGLWAFREEVIDGVASVMRSTIINSSKEMSSYCDYPPPPEFPNFMHNKHLKTYFHMYADHFKVKKHILFKHNVHSVTKANDFKENGEWIITGENEDGPFEKRFSAVMVCIGHHVFPHKPDLPGLDKFRGTVTHTHDYKDYRGYENKKVVVVGIGNSGGDVSVELNRIADQVYLSTRRGAWVFSRVGPHGLPTDIIYIRRIIYVLRSLVPTSWINNVFEALASQKFDHALYNLKPKHRYTEQHVNVNDDLPNCILSGTVQIKDDIHVFTENGVRFKGEEDKEYPIDSLVLATGYDIKFPFLDKSIIDTQENKVDLYKFVFPPDTEHNTLAFIGLIQPFGSIVPISDIQSRWVVQVFQNKLSLPNKNAMLKDIEYEKKNSRFLKTQRHTIQVDYHMYMDQIAKFLGAKPCLCKLLFTDPKLFSAILFGPSLPYHYRVTGIHAWPDARKTILTVMDRVKAPLQTNKGYIKRNQASSCCSAKKLIFRLIAVGIVASGIYVMRNEICEKYIEFGKYFHK